MKGQKELVIIDKEILKGFIRKANCWDALINSAEAVDRIDFEAKDWDLLFLQYAEGRGASVPEQTSGARAISILADADMRYFEVIQYGKRKND